MQVENFASDIGQREPLSLYRPEEKSRENQSIYTGLKRNQERTSLFMQA
jgi:hypothetical protein